MNKLERLRDNSTEEIADLNRLIKNCMKRFIDLRQSRFGEWDLAQNMRIRNEELSVLRRIEEYRALRDAAIDKAA